MNESIDVSELIEVDKFQKLQDDIALATGLAIIAIDYTGKPITKHSYCNHFCQLMRKSKKYSRLCEKCDSRGGLEAVRLNKYYIYHCHADIVDMAIPIIVGGLYVGAFMAGQVRIDRPQDYDKLEHVLYEDSSIKEWLSIPEYKQRYDQIPTMSLERIVANANMLLYFANLCMDKKLTNISKNQSIIGLKAITGKNKVNRILEPSLEYIKNNLDKKITLADMASICHISPSYYSKIFARAELGSLSNYVNYLKVEKAKHYLETTDWPVKEIADKLAYEDSGYFIKIFKERFKMTPGECRTIKGRKKSLSLTEPSESVEVSEYIKK